MSIPLRKPNFDKKSPKSISCNNKNRINSDQPLTILTLKNGLKMVVSCDAYNGIILSGDVYKCVLCNIDLETSTKEVHKESDKHKRSRLTIPHLEHLSENLVRQLDATTCYCTVCNVTTLTTTITRHITTSQHLSELSKAINRAAVYKSDDNNK